LSGSSGFHRCSIVTSGSSGGALTRAGSAGRIRPLAAPGTGRAGPSASSRCPSENVRRPCGGAALPGDRHQSASAVAAPLLCRAATLRGRVEEGAAATRLTEALPRRDDRPDAQAAGHGQERDHRAPGLAHGGFAAFAHGAVRCSGLGG